MANFSVNDIVRKIGKIQKYKVIEVLPVTTEQKYVCIFEPTLAPSMKMTFKENILELAP